MRFAIQKKLPFDGTREAKRQERVERICQLDPKRITTGGRFFTAETHREAEQIAKRGQHG